jgi:hypothetical protein
VMQKAYEDLQKEHEAMKAKAMYQNAREELSGEGPPEVIATAEAKRQLKQEDEERRRAQDKQDRESAGTDAIGGLMNQLGFGNVGGILKGAGRISESMKAPPVVKGANVSEAEAEGIPEAEAVGGAGIAEMAGPIGAVFLVADLAAKELAGQIKDVTASMQFLGDEAKLLAGNDHLGMFNLAVDSTAKMLEKIPISGQIYAAALEAATAPIRIFAEVSEAFVQRGRQIQQYSGELSGAFAISDVRSMMADIREAQDTGPDLARLVDAQSRVSDEFKRILEPLKEFIIGHLADMMEVAADALKEVGPTLAVMQAALLKAFDGIGKILADVAHLNFDDAAKHAAALPDAIKKAMEEAAKKANADRDFSDFIDKQLDDLRDQLGDLPKPNPVPAVPAGGGFGL